MQKVKVFLLLSIIVGMSSGESYALVRKNFYVGLGAGLQSQRYEVKIADAGNNHKVDASRLAPEAALFTGVRARFQNKFFAGLELGASFFPSEVKKDINNSRLEYKLSNKFTAVELSLLIGYLCKKIDTLMYLKLGAEFRNIRLDVMSKSNTVKIDESKQAFGALLGAGVEMPLVNGFYIGAEGKFRFYQDLKYKGRGGSNNLTAKVKPCFEGFSLRLIYPMGQR